jgi:DNA invertase Pin-like site-specific DNA recombinase
MTTFIAYYRVSTTKQADSELGLRAQKASIHAYIASVKGKLIDEVKEVESAANKERVKHGADINLESLLSRRPLLLHAITQAKKSGAVLLVKEVTRLTRFCLLFNYLTATGVKFICTDYPNDDVMMLGFRVQFGEEEARQISKRTKAGLSKSDKAKGIRWKANLAKVDHKNRVKILSKRADDNQNNIRARTLIAHMQKEGKSYRAIADHLNNNSFRSSTGKKFYAITVKRLAEK